MEIKVGDKVRVREDAPKIFLLGWYGFIGNVVDIEDSYAKIECNDCTLVIPTKYLVKVEAKKEAKFKVNDVVRTVFNETTHITSVLENGNYYLYGMGNEYPEDSLTLVEPYTEPTEEKKLDGITEETANELNDMLEGYYNAMETIKDKSYWTAYTADLAKEIAIVYAKQKRDVRMAVRAAKSVVEELKKK